VPAAEQRAALAALLATLKPAELVLPDEVVKKLPPRPSGFPRSREIFPRYTGLMFDKIAPAVSVADMAIGAMLVPDRAARLVEQHVIDPGLPSLEEVVDSILSVTFDAQAADPYQAEIARAVQRVAVEELMQLAANAPMPQVRAVATGRLARTMNQLSGASSGGDAAESHAHLLAMDIKRFLDRPYTAYVPVRVVEPVRGDPIGDSGMEFFRRYMAVPDCDWMDNGTWVPGSCRP
jgi:hypothetical protein